MAADGQARSRRKPIVTVVPIGAPGNGRDSAARAAKPTPAGFGVDLATLDWQRSGNGSGAFEIAFVAGSRERLPGESAGERDLELAPDAAPESEHEGEPAAEADWVLLRIAGDPAARVLVYDRNEWTCFLDGAGHGEFDWPEAFGRVPIA